MISNSNSHFFMRLISVTCKKQKNSSFLFFFLQKFIATLLCYRFSTLFTMYSSHIYFSSRRYSCRYSCIDFIVREHEAFKRFLFLTSRFPLYSLNEALESISIISLNSSLGAIEGFFLLFSSNAPVRPWIRSFAPKSGHLRSSGVRRQVGENNDSFDDVSYREIKRARLSQTRIHLEKDKVPA